MSVKLAAIELDTSIQCRASIDTALVNEYAERMQAGDEFPAVDVFGTQAKCWLADGWHRVLAAKQNGVLMIEAKVRHGGRVDALKHALGANSMHGERRSNADKRRCVEIALREFPHLSSRAVATMCGVDDKTVAACRPTAELPRLKRTGQDGKERPATREPQTKEEAAEDTRRRVKTTAVASDLERALDEAKAWMRRYTHLRPLAPVFEAIIGVERTMS